MPAINTRGALSARGFGFGVSGSAFYPYITQGADNQGTISARNSLTTGGTSGTILKSGVASQFTYYIAFTAADGATLVSDNYYSKDNGVTWLFYNSSSPYGYQYGYCGGGLNNGGAYNPTAKTAVSVIPQFPTKTGNYSGFAWANPTTGSTVLLATGSATGHGLVYSPALGVFVYQTNTGTVYSYSGSSPSVLLGATNLGQQYNTRLYISSDGYPIVKAMGGTTSGNLYKFTSSDLSSYTSLSSYSDSNGGLYQSAAIWSSFASLYYKAAQSSGVVYFGTSSDGSTWSWSYVGNAQGFLWQTFTQVFPVSASEIWIVGGGYITPYGYYPQSYRSLDGGASWSSVSPAYICVAKNLQ